MEKFIDNSETGRQILVGGPTYKDLLKRGVPVDNRRQFPIVEKKDIRPIKQKKGRPPQSRMDEIMGMSVYNIPPLAQQRKLAQAPWQERRFQKLMENVGEGHGSVTRGSATRGWSLRQPQKGRERHEIMDKCGSKCFLGDGESFPICPSCANYEGECRCEIDCDGVNAAFVRARQWKYPGVADAAQTILREKCGRTPQKGGRARGQGRRQSRTYRKY